jgi:hypothetical protein
MASKPGVKATNWEIEKNGLSRAGPPIPGNVSSVHLMNKRHIIGEK